MEVELPTGSLLEETHDPAAELLFGEIDGEHIIHLKSLDYKNVYLSCLKSEVEELTTFESAVLIPVKPFSERLRIYMDDSWLESVEKMHIGCAVDVELRNGQQIAQGILRYKGEITEMGSEGIIFGIELKGHKGDGVCDGSIGNKRYFSCSSNAGLFVPVSKVRPHPNNAGQCNDSRLNGSLNHSDTTGGKSSKSSSRSNRQPTAESSSLPAPISVERLIEIEDEVQTPPLSIDDRVVWISDNGPEYGFVRWIGRLPDVRQHDWMVGVEFDNPVGTGTGNYNDHQLFLTTMNHAAIVPVLGLMKADDFLGMTNRTEVATANVNEIVTSIKNRSGSPQESLPSYRTAVRVDEQLHSRPHCSQLSTPTVPSEDQLNIESRDVRRSIDASRDSLPYLPPSRMMQSERFNTGATTQAVNPYATGHVAKSFNRTGVESGNNPNYSASPSVPPRVPLVPPVYSSAAKNPIRISHDLRMSSESTLNNHEVDAIVHNRPSLNISDRPMLQSTSSQTLYPCSTSDCSTFRQGNRFSTNDSSDPHSPRAGCFQANSSVSTLPHSAPCFHHRHQINTALASSCPEMDGGSYYHVVPDDLIVVDGAPLNRANHVIRLPVVSNLAKSDEEGEILSHSTLVNSNHDRREDNLEANDVQEKNLEVGSVVEIVMRGRPQYGLIKWIGTIPGYEDGTKEVAGIEMEEENSGCTDGTFNGYRLFDCPPKKGFFVNLSQCRKDSRFNESDSIIERPISAEFGSVDCPVVSGDIPPLTQPDDIDSICGKYKGIQGHHNSCYLDATLFSMFSFTPVFDCILHRPATEFDISDYTRVQRVLKEEIVNPLRRNLYVRADRVMKLRKLLDELSSVSGLTSEEKDPEEFLNSLLNQIMKAEPFLKLSSGQETYFYQLFVEKDEKIFLPSVQQLFDQSFLTSDIKLKEIPPCLLIQMPRFGKQFKMYPRIIPSPYLDITDVLEDSPRQCSICGQVADFECKECFRQFGEGLESTAFCSKCLEKSHGHQKRSTHKTTKLRIPDDFDALKDHTPIPRIFMELFAVVCIETSHYVAFVKCGTGPDAPWCFFDSMADRRGEQNGYNIPEVLSFKDLKWWLSDEGFEFVLSMKDDKALPEMPKRLLCDAYMCFYQSPDVMMYK
ncbi:CYLD (predicted) [Pycnogonum litorale]